MKLAARFTFTTCGRRHGFGPALNSHSHLRTIATHTYRHHASALSILSSNVDKSSMDFKENAAQMGEVMARMQELHRKIEEGGPAKARDKHTARGKMLPREYVDRAIGRSG